MTVQRFYAGELTQISDDEVGVICGSDGVKRDGHEFIMRGIDTTNFMRNPVAMCEHTPPPIGVFVRLGIVSAREVGLGIPGDALAGIVKLAPADISDYIAEKRALIKGGYYGAVSLGIDPISTEPLDPRDPYGGVRVTRSEMLEASFVGVPADATALIVARSYKARSAATTAMLRCLPRVPASAIERGMAQAGRVSGQSRPIMMMNQFERTRVYAEACRQRTMACWAVGFARETEQRERYGFEQRQRDLAALREPE
jgi:hypothetical protein